MGLLANSEIIVICETMSKVLYRSNVTPETGICNTAAIDGRKQNEES